MNNFNFKFLFTFKIKFENIQISISFRFLRYFLKRTTNTDYNLILFIILHMQEYNFKLPETNLNKISKLSKS